jgi:UDP-glucose:(heptosyl)LPS alpha-1,3-glucosyltransferase
VNRNLESKSQSVKIGLVRRGYSPTGGAEKYLLRLATELASASHEVVLFSDAFVAGGRSHRAGDFG